MEISLNDDLLLQNKGNKILFDPPPHTHAQKGSRILNCRKCLPIPAVHDLAPVLRPILRLGLSTLFIQNITFLHPSG